MGGHGRVLDLKPADGMGGKIASAGGPLDGLANCAGDSADGK
jgi:hypothetical protein